MENWTLTKEDKEKVIEFISKEILKNHMDKYKFRELVKDKVNTKIIEGIDFEPIIKEATKTYKRSLGSRLAQQADRTNYELFVSISQRLFKLEAEFDKFKESLIIITKQKGGLNSSQA